MLKLVKMKEKTRKRKDLQVIVNLHLKHVSIF